MKKQSVELTITGIELKGQNWKTYFLDFKDDRCFKNIVSGTYEYCKNYIMTLRNNYKEFKFVYRGI